MHRPRRDPPNPHRPSDPIPRSRKYGSKPAVLDHYQQLLTLLKSPDIMEVMQGVSQLSSELVMAQDDVLGAFPLDLMTPPLVECLQKEGIEDVSLYAINCLNQLADALPNVCGIIAACGGVAAVCSKLMNLSYIDVSEQAVKLLDKLAYEHAPLILQEGGLGTVLNVLDFFEAATQKQVLSIIVNLARGVQSQEVYLQYVVPALPLISTFLQYRNQETISTNEKALDFYISLVSSLERVARSSIDLLQSDLEMIYEQGVVQNVMELAQMSRSLLPQIFRLLANLCRGSTKILLEWLRMGGSVLLANTLDLENAQEDEQPKLGAYVIDALQLVDTILPALKSRPGREPDKSVVYKTHPELLTGLGVTIIPKLFVLYERFVNKTVKQLTLDILEKLLAHEQFLQVISPRNISSFLAELLCSKDVTNVKKALSITKMLYEKVPEQVAQFFIKEGVIFRVEALRSSDLKLDFAPVSPLLRENSSRTRLRQLLEGMDYSMEPRLLDQFLRHMRRRDPESEDSDLPISERLKRSLTDPQSDPAEELKSEIAGLTTDILSLNQNCGKESFSRVLNELKSISNRLFSGGSDDPEPYFGQFLLLMTSLDGGISAFEMSASKLSEALWRWITCAQDFDDPAVPVKRMNSVSSRVRDFLKSLLKDRGANESYLQVLVQLLGEVVRHDQQLPLTLYESPAGGSNLITGLRTLSQRAHIQLAYVPGGSTSDIPPDLRTDFETKAAIFGQVGTLGIALEQFQSLETVTEILGKVRNVEDLDMFKTSSYRSASLVRGINQGQMTLIRQHLRLQQMMNENFDLRTSLEELGVLQEGNEELVSELQEQLRHDPEEDEAMESQEAGEEEEAEVVQLRERKVSHFSSSDLVAKLSCNNTEISSKSTVFEVLHKFTDPLSEDPIVIQFRFVKRDMADAADTSKFLYGSHALLWQAIKDSSAVGLESSDALQAPLRLLKFLNAMNRLLPGLFTRTSTLFPGSEDTAVKYPIPTQTFYNPKLSALLAKQTQDVVAVIGHTANDWVWRLPIRCPFIFPFPTRIQLLKGSGISPGKALQHFAGKMKMSGDLLQMRVTRQKVKVDREHILETAIKTMGDKTLLRFGTLEFDYVNEEGTGAGPTLEFYSLSAREIRKLKIWRNTGEETGLFPAPITSDFAQAEELFDFIGRFVGKVICEDKVVDLPLSPVMWKLAFGGSLNMSDLAYVDKGLYRYLTELSEIANRRNWILNNPAFTLESKERQLHQLNYKGTSIQDLSLTFVLPGYNLPLKDNGQDLFVTLDTLDDYIHLVSVKTLMQLPQAAAFSRGVSLTVSVKSLSGFSGDELETLVCGEDGGAWDIPTLQEAVVAAHGYSKGSSVYQNLLLILSQLSAEEKKKCLQFITGSPRLPIGGKGYFRLQGTQSTVDSRQEEHQRPRGFLPTFSHDVSDHTAVRIT